MKKYQIAIILGTMCLLLTLLICVQTRTIKEATITVGSGLQDNSGLRDELFDWQSKYKNAYRQLEELERELEDVRRQAVSSDENDSDNEVELNENRNFLGLTELKGSGIVIKLDDNRDIDSEKVMNISNYLVHEGDLLKIVSELFNAGADAISINGQRIVNTTSIICSGNIIKINGEKIGVPITINAIGFPERLYYALIRPGGYVDIMKQDGVKVDVQKIDEIIVPKYEGVYSSEYIERSGV